MSSPTTLLTTVSIRLLRQASIVVARAAGSVTTRR